jgi:alpha-galactosidase
MADNMSMPAKSSVFRKTAASWTNSSRSRLPRGTCAASGPPHTIAPHPHFPQRPQKWQTWNLLTNSIVLIACSLRAELVQAISPTAAESSAARQWTAARFENTVPLFSFTYGGKPSAELLKNWQLKRASRPLDSQRTEHTLTYTDAATGLVLRCVGVEYRDYPAVEWVLFFRNSGGKDTPIIADIRALDGGIPLARDKQAVLRYARGSECRDDDFAPQVAPLGPSTSAPQGPWVGEGNPVHLQSREGRSSCGVMPFFNVDAKTQGAICAVGWTGDWAADIFRTDGEVRLRAGMQRTHLKLLPGEEIRSPRILLLFWGEDRIRGHNLLRQFILAHHCPRNRDKPARVPVSLGTWGGNFAQNHIAHARWCKDHGVPIDVLWLDAGWYGKDQAKIGANVFNSNWGALVGDWFPNPGYFPQGLGPVSKTVKEMGMGLLLWFEPERVFQGTSWTREHPRYLLGPVGPNFLFNLGDPAARQALTDHLVKLLNDGGITCYRQDFNFDPRPFWDKADAPDRVGIAEIRHITGLYQMWDDLLRRCPGLLIDNCSSGGRRIDLETISRSIPLWRSDVQCFPDYHVSATQNQTFGLSLWTPLWAAMCDRQDTYVFRSAMGPGLVFGMAEFEKDTAKHFDLDWLHKRFNELNQVRDLFLGDFYPLVEYSPSEDVWAAWQFHRADLGAGVVLAFRRAASPFSEAKPLLKGLDPNAVYKLTYFDCAGPTQMTGKQLGEGGLSIVIQNRPAAAMILYKR